MFLPAAVGVVVTAEVARPRAFLVGALDSSKDGYLAGFGIFSSERPKMRANLFPFTALVGVGTSYEEALIDLGRQLAAPPYTWLRRHLDSRSYQSVRETQRRHGVEMWP